MPGAPLELWGGVECTVNRVGDRYFDQLERNGHAARLSDLGLFAGLGVRAMRYPVRWERTPADGVGTPAPTRPPWCPMWHCRPHARHWSVRCTTGCSPTPTCTPRCWAPCGS